MNSLAVPALMMTGYAAAQVGISFSQWMGLRLSQLMPRYLSLVAISVLGLGNLGYAIWSTHQRRLGWELENWMGSVLLVALAAGIIAVLWSGLPDRGTSPRDPADRDAREIVIPAQFKNAEDFSEGLARVREGKLWGFIDTNGAWVVPAKFKSVHDFSNGLARVRTADLWGYIDKSGNFVIPEKFGGADNFEGDLAKVKLVDGASAWIDRSGAVVWQESE